MTQNNPDTPHTRIKKILSIKGILVSFLLTLILLQLPAASIAASRRHRSEWDMKKNGVRYETQNHLIPHKLFQYKVITRGGARGVMVIVVGIGHGDTSSNPGLIAFHIALIPLGKL